MVILAYRAGAPAWAQQHDMYEYWLMPHGLRGIMQTIFWPNATRRRPRPRLPRFCRYVVGPKKPFPILAPGKGGRSIGEHTFWRGSLWGQTVALQGDSTFTKYDLFVDVGDQLHYWGTFRGNGYYDSEESHSFAAPFIWMDRFMSVGDIKEQVVSDSRMHPKWRRVAEDANLSLKLEIKRYDPEWMDPDSQIVYEDVIEMHYTLSGAVVETYHLARGLGTGRFETDNREEPSGVWKQYALYFENFTPPASVTLPWFDPFMNSTFAANEYIDEFDEEQEPPMPGDTVTERMISWDGSSADAVRVRCVRDTANEGNGYCDGITIQRVD